MAARDEFSQIDSPSERGPDEVNTKQQNGSISNDGKWSRLDMESLPEGFDIINCISMPFQRRYDVYEYDSARV